MLTIYNSKDWGRRWSTLSKYSNGENN